MTNTLEPPSVGKGPERGAVQTAPSDPALLRLHAALKQLDGAMHEALRALDVTLGRNPTPPPEDALPYRELGRLKLHLEAATAAPATTPDRNLAGMALDWEDETQEQAEEA
ncbi:MAG: hypothetical protein GKS06_16225 [Acidobacteria bacterium]|nr:hypothetical protein [Acidobacteriota bacterium]